MKPTQLNRLLTLEQSVSTTDGAGGFATAWQSLGNLWAAIVPGVGREVAGEEVRKSTISYRITVRGAPVGSPQRPMPGQRMTTTGRIFNIVAVTEDGTSGHYLTCFAVEESAA